MTKLVYYEHSNYVKDIIAREKQLKGWLRAKKIALIESENPEWKDLSADWFEESPVSTVAEERDPSLRSG